MVFDYIYNVTSFNTMECDKHYLTICTESMLRTVETTTEPTFQDKTVHILYTDHRYTVTMVVFLKTDDKGS